MSGLWNNSIDAVAIQIMYSLCKGQKQVREASWAGEL